MERPDVKFERSKAEWVGSSLMLVIPLVIFGFFYPHSGFGQGDKGLIYFLCADLFVFLFGFYKTLLTPYALQFQEGNLLFIKSLLFPKTLALDDLEAVRITQTLNRDGSMDMVYSLRLKSGDFYDVPSLSHMAGFIEKLNMLYPKVVIEDARMQKDQF